MASNNHHRIPSHVFQDEITRVEQTQESPKRRGSLTSASNAAKRQRTTPRPNQTDIEDMFLIAQTSTISPSKLFPPKSRYQLRSSTAAGKVPALPPRYTLQISDTKTRVHDSLPAEADTLGPRLQVMLYRRLLSELTSTTDPFNFEALWEMLGIDPDVEFSTGFLVQAGLLQHDDGFPTTNLRGLVDVWKKALEASGVDGIDDTLQLVYRLQPKPRKSDSPESDKNNRDSKRDITPVRSNAELSLEARNVARAIRNSLRRERGRQGDGSDAVVRDGELDLDLQEALLKSLGARRAPLSPEFKAVEPEGTFCIRTDALHRLMSSPRTACHRN